MASTVEELTIEYKENDQLLTKELDKKILSKGAWTTIVFHYQDWDKSKEEFGPKKFTVRRYQKRNDAYNMKSKFNISSHDQAQKLIAALESWLND